MRAALVICGATALAIANLLGWAVLLVLFALIVLGAMVLANELARAIIRSMHNGQASRPAGSAKGQGQPRQA